MSEGPGSHPPPLIRAKGRTLAGGAAWAVLQNAIRVGTVLLSVPLALTFLGPERYGLWMVALSVLSAVTFMDLGVTPAVMNKLSEAHGQSRHDVFRYYAFGGLLLGWILLVLGLPAALLAGLVDWAALFRVGDPVGRLEALPLMQVLLLVSFAAVGSVTVDNIFSAQLQVSKPRVYSTIGAVAGFSGLILGIWLNLSLPMLALLNAAPSVLYRAVLLGEIALKQPHLLRRPHDFRAVPFLREMLGSSLLFMGIQLCNVLLSSSPSFLLARSATLSDVSVFNVAFRLVTAPLSVIMSVQNVFWSSFTVAWTQRDILWLRRHLGAAWGGTIVAFSLFTAVLCLGGDWIVSIFTAGRVEVPGAAFLLLGIWLVLQGAGQWLHVFLGCIGDLVFDFVCLLVNAAAMLALSLVLVPVHGVVGACIALTAALFVGNFIPATLRVVWHLWGSKPRCAKSRPGAT